MMSKRPYTRRSPSQWQKHIDNQQTSGLTIDAYCQKHQLATSNFYYWRKKLTPPVASTTEPVETDWVAIPTVSPPLPQDNVSPSKITLSLPNGITLSIEQA